MSRPLLLGAILVLLAIGYQYRVELHAALLNTAEKYDHHENKETKSTQHSSTAKSKTNDKPTKSPPQEYYNPPFDPNNPPEPLYSKSGIRLITKNELAEHAHNGSLTPLWLAVMGRVYDVDKGAEHYYGPNGGYKFFTGRDGSRAFVTGEFNEEGLIEDIDGLGIPQIAEVDGWVQFYDKDYTFVGKLIGRYYNKDGSPTKEWYKFQKALADKVKLDAEREKLERRFPGCNSQWTQDQGGKVYCSDSSGGKQRDWVGYPRRYFAPGAKSWRCACVHDDDLNSPQVKEYPLCDPTSITCKIYPDEIAKLRETGG